LLINCLKLLNKEKKVHVYRLSIYRYSKVKNPQKTKVSNPPNNANFLQLFNQISGTYPIIRLVYFIIERRYTAIKCVSYKLNSAYLLPVYFSV